MPSSSEAQARAQEHSRSHGSDGKHGGSSKTNESEPASRSAATIQAEEEAKWRLDLINTHTGWFARPLLGLSDALSCPAEQLAAILALLLLSINLSFPLLFIPHINALFTLIIPVRCSLDSIAFDVHRPKGSVVVDTAKDAPQWVTYWIVYTLISFIKGWVDVYRPGWKRGWEIIGTVGCIVVAGPWFGRAALRPPAESSQLREAKSREAKATNDRNKAVTHGQPTNKQGAPDPKAANQQDNRGSRRRGADGSSGRGDGDSSSQTRERSSRRGGDGRGGDPSRTSEGSRQ